MDFDRLMKFIGQEFDTKINTDSYENYKNVLTRVDPDSYEWIARQIEIGDYSYRPKPVEIKRLYRKWQVKDGDQLQQEVLDYCAFCGGTGIIPTISRRKKMYYLNYIFACRCIDHRTGADKYFEKFPAGQNGWFQGWDRSTSYYDFIINIYRGYEKANGYDVVKFNMIEVAE